MDERFLRKTRMDGVRAIYQNRLLMEEAGELARAVRAYEIGRDRPDEKDATQAERRQELIEEMGDVLGNLAILADKYGITLEDAMKAHQEKLIKRFETE